MSQRARDTKSTRKFHRLFDRYCVCHRHNSQQIIIESRLSRTNANFDFDNERRLKWLRSTKIERSRASLYSSRQDKTHQREVQQSDSLRSNTENCTRVGNIFITKFCSVATCQGFVVLVFVFIQHFVDFWWMQKSRNWIILNFAHTFLNEEKNLKVSHSRQVRLQGEAARLWPFNSHCELNWRLKAGHDTRSSRRLECVAVRDCFFVVQLHQLQQTKCKSQFF